MEWIIATAVASVMMISYVHGFVFPRTEGERLQKQVDQVGPVLMEIKAQLGRIEGKMSK